MMAEFDMTQITIDKGENVRIKLLQRGIENSYRQVQ